MKKKKDHGGAQLAEAVIKAYARGQCDYYMEPLVRVDENDKPVGKIKDGDAVIFCCRRGEREIELTDMFTDKDFDKVERTWLPNLKFVILTLYHEKFKDLSVAFAPQRVTKPLAQVISEGGLSQFHCAESEKFAHVTFFLNGGNNQPYPGEEDICVPSPKELPFHQKPELSLPGVVDQVVDHLGKEDFIVVNFANGDIIGHTSDKQAKIAAAGHISSQLGRLVAAAQEKDYVIAVTADHGNLETMTTADGKPHMAHTSNLVPFVLIDPRSRGPIPLRNGSLCDVAPTVLQIMGLAQPPEMTADSLLLGQDFGPGRKVLLVILDGWGLGGQDETNPIYLGNTNDWDELIERYPHCLLHASGSFVGLGEGRAGNSEAGHLNLGAGRVVSQDDQRLDKAMADGTFAQSPVFLITLKEAKERGAALHLLAYLTKESSHGSIDYAVALCEMAKELPEIYLHIIFDGRSTEPGSAPQMLLELDRRLSQIGAGQIVDGVGRGIVLERDQDYGKVKLGYDAMVLGIGTYYS